ncbi:hypothetical protein ACFQZ1_10385 [Bacillus sp. CGMCC 1.60114]
MGGVCCIKNLEKEEISMKRGMKTMRKREQLIYSKWFIVGGGVVLLALVTAFVWFYGVGSLYK